MDEKAKTIMAITALGYGGFLVAFCIFRLFSYYMSGY